MVVKRIFNFIVVTTISKNNDKFSVTIFVKIMTLGSKWLRGDLNSRPLDVCIPYDETYQSSAPPD
jgi:hypothetical protein